MDWKVEKKTKNNFRRPRKFVRKISAWLVCSKQLNTIENTPHPHNTQLWGMVVLNQLKTIKPSWYHIKAYNLSFQDHMGSVWVLSLVLALYAKN